MSRVDEYIKELQDKADKQSKYLKLAFLAAIVELRKQAQDNQSLSTAIESKNIDEILRQLNINGLDNLLYGIGMDKSNFIFTDEITETFKAGAMAAFWELSTDKQKMFNFNSINERAIAFVQQDAANLTASLVSTTTAGARQAITRILAETLNVERQISEITRLVGLTNDQVTAVLNFSNQLEARQVLGFTSPTDRRISETDRILINQHMKGTPLSQERIDKLVNNYYESLLNKRAIDIATTESMRAINNGQQELWEQGLDSGVLNETTDRKFWITMNDKRVRATHSVIPGMNPNGVKIRSMFITPFGPVNSPGDRRTGGFINCRCQVMILGSV